MVNPIKQPVTWQDYANLWSSDPKYRQQYEVIKPTLDALGITPQDIQPGFSITIDVILPGGRQASDLIGPEPSDGGRYATNTQPGNGAPPGAGSTLGPGLPPQAEQYRSMIERASQQSGVPASLIAALIHDESRWDPQAGTVNGGNGHADIGLVQMNENTFRELQARHPELRGKSVHDPETNILAGALYLMDMKEEMKRKYGIDSWEIALRAYNSGPNGVDPGNLSALPAGTGTANYIEKIMDYWHRIDNGIALPA